MSEKKESLRENKKPSKREEQKPQHFQSKDKT